MGNALFSLSFQVLSLTLWGGYLHPFTPSKINDRFLLGGPSTLRGFGLWGAGPRTNGFSTGGEAYWASGLHLYAPVPLLPQRGLFNRIRLHGFATGGNIVKKGTYAGQVLEWVIFVWEGGTFSKGQAALAQLNDM